MSRICALLFFGILALLPHSFVDPLRSGTVALLSPIWHIASIAKHYLADRPVGYKQEKWEEELDRLRRDNQWLQTELAAWKEATFCHEGSGMMHNPSLFSSQREWMEAHILYRDPNSWSRSFWIDVGTEDRSETVVLEKNSPVLVGPSLIGIVDYVGRHQSRVRLITDGGVAPAVRVVRGEGQNRHLAFELATMRKLLAARHDLFHSPEEREACTHWLKTLEARLGDQKGDSFLAKGVLQGEGAPFVETQTPILKGVAFNFDFPDAPDSFFQGEKREPILREGDLLVTSGLDGLFPPGLWVATVQQVQPKGSSYELTALATARSFHSLETVYLLPPVPND